MQPTHSKGLITTITSAPAGRPIYIKVKPFYYPNQCCSTAIKVFTIPSSASGSSNPANLPNPRPGGEHQVFVAQYSFFFFPFDTLELDVVLGPRHFSHLLVAIVLFGYCTETSWLRSEAPRHSISPLLHLHTPLLCTYLQIFTASSPCQQ